MNTPLQNLMLAIEEAERHVLECSKGETGRYVLTCLGAINEHLASSLMLAYKIDACVEEEYAILEAEEGLDRLSDSYRELVRESRGI
jgi:hypothetical protein